MSEIRAFGLIRVSQQGEREDERFHSPGSQEEAIRAFCEDKGWSVTMLPPEINVSGGASLENRPSLSRAVAAIAAGNAQRLVALDASRLFRSVDIRTQVLRAVEGGGGEAWTVKNGRITNRTARAKALGNVETTFDEMVREESTERSRVGVAEAVAQGKVPWRHIVPGYRRGPSGALVPHEREAPIVRRAFELRAAGATIGYVRAHLQQNGIERTTRSTITLLASTVVLGRIDFGGLVNPNAHEPIVDRDLWEAAQNVRVPRGRQPKSEALLARLGVLRCGTCGARMVIGTRPNGRQRYRCPPPVDCPRGVSIEAPFIEGVVVGAVRTALADAEGHASALERAEADRAAAEAADAELRRAIAILDAAGVEGEDVSVEKLRALREARDAARSRADESKRAAGSLSIAVGTDWDRMSIDARRALIRTVVDRVDVAPGQGSDRVAVRLVQ